jgi:hypothetical protein
MVLLQAHGQGGENHTIGFLLADIPAFEFTFPYVPITDIQLLDGMTISRKNVLTIFVVFRHTFSG